MEVDPYMRVLADNQRCVVSVVMASTGAQCVVFESNTLLLEAPNWTLDGSALILNGHGRLWRLDLGPSRLSDITPGALPPLNNDHVLDPDGEHIFLSASDGHIYRARLGAPGSEATRVTGNDGLLHFLHGVSPDGEHLAFIGIDCPKDGHLGMGSVYTTAATGGVTRRLTCAAASEDGSEYSPDGRWIYFNSEQFDGHAQVARARTDGSGIEQLTSDDRVNWFPHLAPRGPFASYLAFPRGTSGHPADVWVDVMVVRNGRWAEGTSVARVFGGQGTNNVNSWNPSGSALAFVSYPLG